MDGESEGFLLEQAISSLLLLVNLSVTFSFACFKLYIKHLEQVIAFNCILCAFFVVRWLLALVNFFLIDYRLHSQARLIEISLFYAFMCALILILWYFKSIGQLFNSNRAHDLDNMRNPQKRSLSAPGQLEFKKPEWRRPHAIDTILFITLVDTLLVFTHVLTSISPITRHYYTTSMLDVVFKFKECYWRNLFAMMGRSSNFLTLDRVPIALLAVNCYLVWRLQWLKVDRNDTILSHVSQLDQHVTRRVFFKFFLRSFTPPVRLGLINRFCPICMKPKPTTNFCHHHAFHVKCMIKHLSDQCRLIADENRFRTTYHHRAHENVELGQQYDDDRGYYSYDIELERSYLNACPRCKTNIDGNTLEISVEDCLSGLVDCNVKLID